MSKPFETIIQNFYKNLEVICTNEEIAKDKRLIRCKESIEVMSTIIALLDYVVAQTQAHNKPKDLLLYQRYTVDEILPTIVMKNLILYLDVLYHYNKNDDFYTLKSLIKDFVPKEMQNDVLAEYNKVRFKWEKYDEVNKNPIPSPFKKLRHLIAHNMQNNLEFYSKYGIGGENISNEQVTDFNELIFNAIELFNLCFLSLIAEYKDGRNQSH